MNLENSRDTIVFGCGYLGRRVAARLIAEDYRVWGVTRSRAKADRLAQYGILPIIADWTDRRTLCNLPPAARMLVAVSYDRTRRYDRYESQVGGLRNLLQQTADETDVCYISTTGVYHQRDGSWVDESSPCRPATAGGKTHLAAESLLRRMRPTSPWTILRLAGIYGFGRIPRVADVIAGRPIASPQYGYLNLIHVEDAAQAVLQSWELPSERLYVVADDRPIIRGDFYREVARRFRAPAPTFVDPPAEAPVAQRANSNKRVSNRRMKRDLLTRLRYPTFVEGLEQATDP